jgi:hypothetical protein
MATRAWFIIALLERLRDGADALAWEEFFAHYWTTIYNFARHRGCSDGTLRSCWVPAVGCRETLIPLGRAKSPSASGWSRD